MHKIIRFLKELTISIHHIPKSEVYIYFFFIINQTLPGIICLHGLKNHVTLFPGTCDVFISIHKTQQAEDVRHALCKEN